MDLSEKQKKQVQEFHENGVLVLKGLFSNETMDSILKNLNEEYKEKYNKSGQHRAKDVWKGNNIASNQVTNIGIDDNM